MNPVHNYLPSTNNYESSTQLLAQYREVINLVHNYVPSTTNYESSTQGQPIDDHQRPLKPGADPSTTHRRPVDDQNYPPSTRKF